MQVEEVQSLLIPEFLCGQYEWNARTQVTMWYDSREVNQSKLHDYGKNLNLQRFSVDRALKKTF